MLCASIGSESVLKAILRHRPLVNEKDSFGRTALHLACRRGDKKIVKQLLKLDYIELDAQTNGGITPLMMAVNSRSVKTVMFCLEKHMNPFLVDGL